jgi:hypothetical protein
MKKIYGIFVIALALSLVIPGYMGDDIDGDGCTPPTLNLPTYPVNMTADLFPPSWNAAFKVEITGIYGLYDVNNGTYPGWCVEYGTAHNTMPVEVILNSSYDPPAHLAHENWSKVNYILNHKQGDRVDVQRAIWYFINFGTWDWDREWGPMTLPVTQYTWNMIDNATAHADEWCPGYGDVIAVICDQGIDRIYQLNLIEVTIYEGATPGFWKNKGVKLGWPTPYTTDMTLADAGFIIPDGAMTDNDKRPVYSDDTLLDALNYKGGDGLSGMAQTLLRAAVAAVLNAAHDNITYPLTETEIFDQVNTALPQDRMSMEDLKDELDMYNNYGYEEWW